MLKGFEDAFMDAQSRDVALCIELLENSNVTMDKVYIYMYQNEYQDFYNAFFEKDRRIYRVNELYGTKMYGYASDKSYVSFEGDLLACLEGGYADFAGAVANRGWKATC